MRFRRSIYRAQDVKAGRVLTRENLRIIRPGFGFAPRHDENLLGRRVNQDLAVGTAMDWALVGSRREVEQVMLTETRLISLFSDRLRRHRGYTPRGATDSGW